MTTIAASIPLSQAAALMGRPWGSAAGDDGVSDTEFAMLRALLTRRLQLIWENPTRWPDLRSTERRFRELTAFYSGTGYSAGSRLYDYETNACYAVIRDTTALANADAPTDNPSYYALLQDDSGVGPVTDFTATYKVGDRVLFTHPDLTNRFGVYYCYVNGATYSDIVLNLGTKWYKMPTWNPEFPLDDGTNTPIGDVYRVWTEYPTPPARNSTVPFELNENGLRVYGDPGSAWVDYKPRSHVFTGDAWDSTAAYVSGNQVYFDNGTTGDFWEANSTTTAGQSPTTNASKWDKMEIPAAFGGYLQWGVYADWLNSEGQTDKATAANRMAEQILRETVGRVVNAQAQTSPTRIRTR